MLLPNKTITYEQSIFPAMEAILEALCQGPLETVDLFIRVKDKVKTSAMFQDALDALYALNRIRLEGSVLSYVD